MKSKLLISLSILTAAFSMNANQYNLWKAYKNIPASVKEYNNAWQQFSGVTTTLDKAGLASAFVIPVAGMAGSVAYAYHTDKSQAQSTVAPVVTTPVVTVVEQTASDFVGESRKNNEVQTFVDNKQVNNDGRIAKAGKAIAATATSAAGYVSTKANNVGSYIADTSAFKYVATKTEPMRTYVSAKAQTAGEYISDTRAYKLAKAHPYYTGGAVAAVAVAGVLAYKYSDKLVGKSKQTVTPVVNTPVVKKAVVAKPARIKKMNGQ